MTFGLQPLSSIRPTGIQPSSEPAVRALDDFAAAFHGESFPA
jgi:hypothetical protein